MQGKNIKWKMYRIQRMALQSFKFPLYVNEKMPDVVTI